ncbi:hypothetical protein Patl1_17590 [Pistacia atlantica]|uniref:Uncharacterized protein n=1 Tax=Pistacia atlantica TaxID=434234 RepID=A0ACC1C0F8_9ROSI|nr:hypothetical protein Patl1_17590 [Pistacia atlantica]
MHIPSEAPVVIEDNRPPLNWPTFGKVEINNLKVRYQPNAPLVLQGVGCAIERGHKIGIVGQPEIWEVEFLRIMLVLGKGQLQEVIQEKEEGINSFVAHRIPVVMDCNAMLAISDGDNFCDALNQTRNLIEHDEPLKLMNKEGSLFGQLVKEHWSHTPN